MAQVKYRGGKWTSVPSGGSSSSGGAGQSAIVSGGSGGGSNTYSETFTPIAPTSMGGIRFIDTIEGSGGPVVVTGPGAWDDSASEILSKIQPSQLSAGSSTQYDPATKTTILKTTSQASSGTNIDVPLSSGQEFKGETSNMVYKGATTSNIPLSSAVASTTPKAPVGFFGRVLGGIDTANLWLQEKVTYPAFNFIRGKTGIDLTTVEGQNIFTPSIIGVGSYGFKPKPEGDLIGGISAGILKDIKEKPAKQGILLGAGGAVGFVAEGVMTGASAISATLGTATNIGVTAGGLGLGGYYVYKVGEDVAGSKSIAEAGGKIGVGGKDLVLFGKGYSTGVKGFQMGRGVISNWGRTFMETEQGVFPSAKQKTHLKLFKENVVKEFGDKPGAYHTTSDAFWKGDFTPGKGTSELPGTYGSTMVSTTFSRIQGSAPGVKFKIGNFIKGILAPKGEPGVAFLQPAGFRGSAVKYTNVKLFEGQRFIKGKGYAYFAGSAKKGWADVPGIKPEIESVHRIDAGSYKLVLDKFYTTIAGVRTKVDSFSAIGAGSASSSSGVSYSPSSYSGAPSSSGSSSGSIGAFFIGITKFGGSSVKFTEIPASTASKYFVDYYPTPSSGGSSSGSSSGGGSSYGGSSYIPSSIPPSSIPPSSIPPSSVPPSSPPSSSPPSSPPPSSLPPSSPPTEFSSYTPPILFGGGLGFLGTRKYKGKRKFKYTPSYVAFVFGIKGKAPKGREMGLRLRPITKGFRFGKIRGGFKTKITGFGFGGFSGFKGFSGNAFSFRNNLFKIRKRRRKKK